MAVKRLTSNISNAMRDVLVVITEYERLSVTSMSDHPYTMNSLTSTQLRKAERDVQMKAMRDWFYQNYDTLDELPYDSSEGGYQFIWGGPYDAREQLEGEFSGVVPDDVIKELAEELDDISSEWSGRAYDDPDDYLFSFSPSDLTIYDTFQMNLHNIESLLSLKASGDLKKPLHRMCFASIITAFETYLADTFTVAVKSKTEVLERFVESNPDFQQEKFPLSEVFKRSKEIEKKAFSYLSSMVWHNLAKVMPLYKTTLSIAFPTDMDSVHKAIVDRHDIVHRNGKSTDGTEGSWGEKEVKELMQTISGVVQHIENQINPKAKVEEDIDLPF